MSVAGTGTLLRFALRNDRRRLVTWTVSLAGVTVYAAGALGAVYATQAERQARAGLVRSPAAVLFSGPGYGTDRYTLGAMLANELALSVMVAAAIMSILLVVRHTRAEEESGRADLVRAGSVGHRAPLTAALALAGIANAAVTVVVAGGLAAFGLAPVDAAALALGVGLTGLVFGAVAAVTAQATAYARAATGGALAVLGAAVVIRGIGDMDRVGGSPLSWLSPIAWAQQTRAFVDLRWWPLLLPALLTAVLVAVAYAMVSRRDVAAGLLPPRPGPARASALLAGPTGLAVRLQRASVIAWAAALALLGVTYGSLTDAVADTFADNPQLASVLQDRAGGGALSDAFASLVAFMLALGAAAFAVSSVLRLRSEERSGRTEVLLATAVDRRRLLGAAVAVSSGAAALLLLVAGLADGVAAAATTGDASRVATLLGAALAPLPAVLVVIGVAALLVGLAPRFAGLAWVLVGWAVLIGVFGGLLRLPEWTTKLSPFGWVPAFPGEDLDAVPLVGLTLVAAALLVVALAGFRRRDLAP